MGRKKLEPRVELVTDAPLDTQGLGMDVSTMAKLEAAFTHEQRQATLLIGERLGLRKALRMVSKLLTVTDILDLQRIKESKIYKGYTHIGEDGNSQSITTWADYCKLVEGRSAEAVDLDIRNLRQMGEEWFDSMRQIGIGPGRMREIRKLPDDAQTALLEAARDGDKETLLDLAEELISKHAKEKEALEAELKDVKEDYEALGSVCATHSKRADELQVAQEILKRKIQTQPAPERSTQLLGEAAQIGIKYDLGLRGELRAAFTQLEKDTEVSSLDHRNFMAGVVRELEITLAVIRSEFNLPDTADQDFSLLSHVEGMPEWMTHEQ